MEACENDYGQWIGYIQLVTRYGTCLVSNTTIQQYNNTTCTEVRDTYWNSAGGAAVLILLLPTTITLLPIIT